MSSILDFQILMGPDGRMPEPEAFRGTVRAARAHFFSLLNARHAAIDHASLALVLRAPVSVLDIATTSAAPSATSPAQELSPLVPYIVIHRSSDYVLRYLVSHSGAPAGEPWLADDHPAMQD